MVARYQKLVIERPGDQVAISRLMDLVRKRDGNLSKLLVELETLASAGGETKYAALLALAEVATSTGDLPRAQRVLLEVSSSWPKRPEAQRALARLARAQGDLAGAKASLERALPLESGISKEETLSELWQLCLELSDLECAQRHHGALVRLARGNGFVAGELGRALLARGRHREAVVELRRVARGAEGDGRALVPALRDLGRAELVSGEAGLALQTLSRASRLSEAEPGLRAEIDVLRADAHRALGTLDDYLNELERGPETADRLALLGRLYEERGQLDRAARAYRRASALTPTDIDLRLALVRLLELTLDLDGAQKELAKLVRQAPGQLDLVLRHIDVLLASGKRQQALVEFDRAVVTFEQDATASFLLLELAERLQEAERAKRIELAQAARSGLGRKHLVELGSRAYRQGDGDKARALWKRLLTDRDTTQGAVLYGETLLAHDDVQGGLEALERAVAGAPAALEPKVALARGLLRAAALATGPAKKDYERRALLAWLAVLEDPSSKASSDRSTRGEARRQVVRLLKRTGRLTLEMAALERAFLAPEPNTDAGLTLAEAQILTKNPSDAERTLARLHQLLPGDREVLVRLERVQLDQGKTEAALGTLERLLVIDPTRAQVTLGRLADLAFDLHDDKRAIGYAERACSLDASDAEALSKLGDLYEKSGRLPEAEAAYRKALAQDGQLHAVAIKLGRLLSKRGEGAEALGLLLRSLRSAHRADDIALLGRQALGAAVSTDLTRELEDQLRPLCISRPEAVALRALLLDVLTKERQTLEDRTTRADSVAAQAARKSLADLADRNLGPLLSVLAAADLHEQEQVILLLGWGNADGAGAALLDFAEGPAPEPLRVAAIAAATKRADERLAPRLTSLLTRKGQNPRGALALAVVRGLSALESHEARRGLEFALKAEDPDIRTEALLALSQRQPALSEATLVHILASETEGDAARAAAALAFSTRPRAKTTADLLLGQLEQAPPIVHAGALTALAWQAPTDQRFLEAAAASLLGSDARSVAAGIRALALTEAEVPRVADRARATPSFAKDGSSSVGSAEERLWQLMTATPPLAVRVRVLEKYQSYLITALEVALKTSRASAIRALGAMARSDGLPALSPLYAADNATSGSGTASEQQAVMAARSIHLAVLPWVIQHAQGSDLELATLALGTLCPDQDAMSRLTLERALAGKDDAKFEAAAFALTECKVELAMPLLGDFLKTGPAWPRQRRMAAVLEAIGARQKPPLDPAIRDLLGALSRSENELVKGRALSAERALGLADEETE
jgi:tetratricopeptide (TPR) repeat protein